MATLVTAAFATLLSVLLGSLASYGLTRFSSKLGNLFLVFTLGVRLNPLISIVILLYRIIEFLTAYNLDLGPMTAAATLFSLPVMLFSFFMQNYIVRGMTMGAVKE